MDWDAVLERADDFIGGYMEFVELTPLGMFVFRGPVADIFIDRAMFSVKTAWTVFAVCDVSGAKGPWRSWSSTLFSINMKFGEILETEEGTVIFGNPNVGIATLHQKNSPKLDPRDDKDLYP